MGDEVRDRSHYIDKGTEEDMKRQPEAERQTRVPGGRRRREGISNWVMSSHP